MSEGALNLVDHVLPDVPLRQFVLTVPFPLRFPIAFDGALLGQVVRIFVDTVATWYRRRHLDRGLPPGETGAVAVIQRGNSDLRLNPHLHTAFLDGVYAPDRDRYFGSARQGFFRWEIDLTYHVMRGLELLGLVWNLRCVPEHLLARPDATPRSALSER
jgi:hypothetical protein